MLTWCHSECCVVSGLDFEAAGGSAVRSCLSNYSLRGHQVAVGALSRLDAVALERASTPLFGRLVRCSAHGRSFTSLQYINSSPRVWLITDF